MTGKTIQQLQVGDKAELRKTFVEEDVAGFASYILFFASASASTMAPVTSTSRFGVQS